MSRLKTHETESGGRRSQLSHPSRREPTLSAGAPVRERFNGHRDCPIVGPVNTLSHGRGELDTIVLALTAPPRDRVRLSWLSGSLQPFLLDRHLPSGQPLCWGGRLPLRLYAGRAFREQCRLATRLPSSVPHVRVGEFDASAVPFAAVSASGSESVLLIQRKSRNLSCPSADAGRD